jgi:hypothetical protein
MRPARLRLLNGLHGANDARRKAADGDADSASSMPSRCRVALQTAANWL